MNNGRIFVGAIVISAIVAGFLLYYLQVYAYFEDVTADSPEAEIKLTGLVSEQPEAILVENFQGIDATSSPLRFRACFDTTQSQAMLTETYVIMDAPIPLIGPNWFKCYDAVEIGEALERGDAIAFLGQKEIADGVDRVIAIFPDGRGYVWHQLNDKYKE